MDSLQSIAVLVKVAETGSFTGAAKSLAISPSGVSKSLRRLEDRLKIRLVSRSTRSVHLTDEGRMLVEQYRQILVEIEDVEALLARRLARPSGRVRLQVPVGLGRRVITPLMVRFSEEFPEICLDIEMSDRSANPTEEGIDVAVRAGNPDDSRLVARKLGEIQFQAVASPHYLSEYGEPYTPAELVSHRCLSYYIPHSGRYREWQFEATNGKRFTQSLPGRLNVNNAQALMYAAIDGAGIALLSKFIVSDAVRAGQLQPILRGYKPIGPTAWLLYGEQRFQLPRVRAVVEFLLQRFPAILDSHHF